MKREGEYEEEKEEEERGGGGEGRTPHCHRQTDDVSSRCNRFQLWHFGCTL